MTTRCSTSPRNSSFELLRLILMFCILLHHVILVGLGLQEMAYTNEIPIIRPGETRLFYLVNSLCIPAVNVFVLISGFFEMRPSIEKAVSLLISMSFYTLAFTFPYLIGTGDYFHALSCLSILSHSPYWFLIDYFFLMLFAPLLNMMFRTCGKAYIHYFIAGLLIISVYFGFVWGHPANSNGYTLLQFIMLYCIGRYIRINDITLSKRTSLLLYLAGSLLCGYGMWQLWTSGHHALSWHLRLYNNPLLILSAIGAFLFFKELHFSSRIINKLAESSLSVYLFSCSKFFWLYFFPFIPLLYKRTASGIVFLAAISALALVTMLVSIGINQVQLSLNRPLTRYISKKLRTLLRLRRKAQ